MLQCKVHNFLYTLKAWLHRSVVVCLADNPWILGSNPVLGKKILSRRGKKGPRGRTVWTLGMISRMFFNAFRLIFKYRAQILGQTASESGVCTQYCNHKVKKLKSDAQSCLCESLSTIIVIEIEIVIREKVHNICTT